MDLYIFIITWDVLKKYVTEEEKLNVKRTRAKKYYWDNKQDQDEKHHHLYNHSHLHRIKY